MAVVDSQKEENEKESGKDEQVEKI